MVEQTQHTKKDRLCVFANEEVVSSFIDSIVSDDKEYRVESLAIALIELLDALREGQTGEVIGEMERLLECTFRHSETYDLAFELYERRFDIKGGSDPARVLRGVLETHLPDEGGDKSSDNFARKEREPLPRLLQKKADVHRISLMCDDEAVLDRMIEAGGEGRQAEQE
jgi:hypothetical protein